MNLLQIRNPKVIQREGATELFRWAKLFKAKNWEEGLAEGRLQEKVQIASNLKNSGMKPTDISKLMELSIEEIQKL